MWINRKRKRNVSQCILPGMTTWHIWLNSTWLSVSVCVVIGLWWHRLSIAWRKIGEIWFGIIITLDDALRHDGRGECAWALDTSEEEVKGHTRGSKRDLGDDSSGKLGKLNQLVDVTQAGDGDIQSKFTDKQIAKGSHLVMLRLCPNIDWSWIGDDGDNQC